MIMLITYENTIHIFISKIADLNVTLSPPFVHYTRKFDPCTCLIESKLVYLFIYLGFYVAFNTVQVISRRVVGRAEETSTYSSLGLCTVNCRPTASNYTSFPTYGHDGDQTPAAEVGESKLGFASHLTARVILGQVLSITTWGVTIPHRDDSL